MNDGTALQTTLVQWHHKFLKSSLGCFIFLFLFFPFEILSNVVVVTLATAAIALLCLLTSTGKKIIMKIHLRIEHVGTNF